MMNHNTVSFLSHQLYPSDAAIQMSSKQEKGGRRRRKKVREGDLKKRKLSEEQANLLEESFAMEQKLETDRKDRLAFELGMEPKQVAVWFQNRRTRWKNKKLEEEYSKLKTAHENDVVQKCRLESEVLGLKDRLREAEKEMQRMMEESERGGLSNSPSLSSPSSAADVAFHGGFDSDNSYENLFYVPENCYDQLMDWINLYM